MLFQCWSGMWAAPASARHHSCRWNITERSRGSWGRDGKGPWKDWAVIIDELLSKGVFTSMYCLSFPRKKILRIKTCVQVVTVEGDSREQEWGTRETGRARRESWASCIGHCCGQLGPDFNRNFWMCLQLTSQWRSIFKSSSIDSHSALGEGWLPQRILMPFAPLGYTEASHTTTLEKHFGGQGRWAVHTQAEAWPRRQAEANVESCPRTIAGVEGKTKRIWGHSCTQGPNTYAFLWKILFSAKLNCMNNRAYGQNEVRGRLLQVFKWSANKNSSLQIRR